MILELVLSLDFPSADDAENVLKALSPDNIKIPPDLSLEMTRNGKKLKIFIKSNNIKRARSSLDEILALISSLEKLNTLKANKEEYE